MLHLKYVGYAVLAVKANQGSQLAHTTTIVAPVIDLSLLLPYDVPELAALQGH